MNQNAQSLDRLNPIFKVGLERTEMMLETIAKSPIMLELKRLEIIPPQELLSQLKSQLGLTEMSAMELVFSGDYNGMTQLVFPVDTAKLLIDMIETEERRKLDQDELEKGILSEVGHIFFNGVMGVISTLSEYGITYMIPKYKVGNIGQLLLSSWSKNYSSALMGSIELSRQRELWFWFQFNTLDPLLQHSQKLSDYF
jgi:chemotaxis protein CheC